MSQERSEAIVLRSVDFSETSRIVTLLTPERGKLACMAAGVKRTKSPLAGALDTFNHVEIVYYWRDSRTVQRLAEASVFEDFRALKRDLDKSLYAAFSLEIAYKVAQENEPSIDLYSALLSGLRGMCAWQGDPRVHALWESIRLLTAAGFQLPLESRELFDTMTDRVLSHRGGRAISVDDFEKLRALSANTQECPPMESAGGAFRAMTAYVTRHLESDFRSLRVLEQMERQKTGSHAPERRP